MNDSIIERLEGELKEVKNKISELRKRGIDTKIIDLKIINIPSKINLAKITKDEKDAKKVIDLLNNLKQEIQGLEGEKSVLEKDLSREAEEVYKKEKERLEEEENKNKDLSKEKNQ